MLLVITIMVILFSIGIGIFATDRKPLAMKAAARTALAQWDQTRQTAQAKGVPARLFAGPITSEGKPAAESIVFLVATNQPLAETPETPRWIASGRPLRVANLLSIDLAASTGWTVVTAAPDGGTPASWATLETSPAPFVPSPQPSLVLLFGQEGPKQLKTTLHISQTGHGYLVENTP
jgi:hypothetical protein